MIKTLTVFDETRFQLNKAANDRIDSIQAGRMTTKEYQAERIQDVWRSRLESIIEVVHNRSN